MEIHMWDEAKFVHAEKAVRLGETETHYVDIRDTIYNYRLVLSDKSDPGTYRHYWCYQGKSPELFMAVLVAVMWWAKSGADEPAGWIKNGQTGETRIPVTDGGRSAMTEDSQVTTKEEHSV